jgi:catalase
VKEAAARDFVADAFAHCKFIAHVDAAQPLLDKAGVEPDEAVMPLGSPDDIATFIESCRKLRLWAREQKVKL